MLNTSLHVADVTENATLQNTVSVHGDSPTVSQNITLQDGCQKVVFNEMEFLPWNNPDNIVSAKVESVTSVTKDIMLVLLFLIGGPGNVINMAVFYKQGLKDRVNLCLFALSLADELYLIASICIHAEQLFLQFTTKARYGIVYAFLANHNVTGLLGFVYVSLVLSAIIASERCLCVLRPLKFQTLMRTRTMATVICVVYVLVVGLYFIVAFRMRIGCLHDPTTGVVLTTVFIGEFYKRHKYLVDYVDSFIFGAGLPGIAMIVVIATTIITTIKLRQVVTWRTETSSSISPREVALTKMLIGTSILFIICVFPFAVSRFSWLFLPEMNSGRRNHNFYLTTFWVNKILTYINASFNIFVYYAMGSRYRESFLALFTRKSRGAGTGLETFCKEAPSSSQQ
ncbi:galanin receptor 2a-like [Babylonia areolata]|uniref:galanin receptor 2a-like n=1 Tax=Babylonia areolata TaxID=304850 RepID=UPI003FD24775